MGLPVTLTVCLPGFQRYPPFQWVIYFAMVQNIPECLRDVHFGAQQRPAKSKFYGASLSFWIL